MSIIEIFLTFVFFAGGVTFVILAITRANIFRAGKISPFISIVIAAGLFIVPFGMSWFAWEDIPTITEEAVIGGVTFDITSDVDHEANWDMGGNMASDDDDRTIIVPITIASHVAKTSGVHIENFGVNFSIDPIAPPGAETTNLATIYYSTEYNMAFGGEYLLNKSGTHYEAYCIDAGSTEFYEGQQSMELTATNAWVNFSYNFDNTSSDSAISEFTAIGDTILWDIDFWNDEGWRETWDVTFIVIGYS